MNNSVTLLDFWAPWCGPCKIMNPVIDELEKEMGDKLKVDRINVDEDPAKSQQLGVMSIPTYIVMKDGKEVGRKIGVTPKAELQKLLQG
jgi:thioredoxin 1